MLPTVEPVPSLKRYEQRNPGFWPDFPRVVTLSGKVLCYQYVAGTQDALRPVPYFDFYGPTQVKYASTTWSVRPLTKTAPLRK